MMRAGRTVLAGMAGGPLARKGARMKSTHARTTFAVRRTGSIRRSTWTVTDGDAAIAVAHTTLISNDMRIDVRGRSLTFHMPSRRPREFTLEDDATGELIISGRHHSGGRDRGNLVNEQWRLDIAGRDPIQFTYRHREPRGCGFTDQHGASLLTLGHDPSFDARGSKSWVRILMRMWGAALKSIDRYLVHVHDATIDAPVLALVGVWMERTADSRYPSSA